MRTVEERSPERTPPRCVESKEAVFVVLGVCVTEFRMFVTGFGFTDVVPGSLIRVLMVSG